MTRALLIALILTALLAGCDDGSNDSVAHIKESNTAAESTESLLAGERQDALLREMEELEARIAEGRAFGVENDRIAAAEDDILRADVPVHQHLACLVELLGHVGLRERHLTPQLGSQVLCQGAQ